MVLDIAKYFENLIKKEMKVSHFNGDVFVGKANKIKPTCKQAIQKQYGQTFLQDANYIAIFQQDESNTSSMKNLFNLVNRALGKDANNMTQADFKKATFGGAAADDEIDADTDDTEDDVDTDADVDTDEPEDADDEESMNEDENAVDANSFIFMKITVK